MNVRVASISLIFGRFWLSFTLIFNLVVIQSVSQTNSNIIDPNQERFLELNSIASINYLKDSTYVFTDEENSWKLKSKSTFAYDFQGNEVHILESDFIDNIWVKNLKSEKSYGPTQLLTYERNSMWDRKYRKWKFLQRKDFFYNSVDLLEFEISYNRNGDLWQKNTKHSYKYNESYNVESISEFEWKAQTQNWIPFERTLYEYTDSDNIDIEIVQIWSDSLGSWLNSTSRDYTYDENNNLISSTRSSWSMTQQSWVNISMISLIYNEKGQIQGTRQVELSPSAAQNLVSQDVTFNSEGNPGETIISNWNADDEEWESVTRKVHFWSENITGNLGSNTDEIDCSFMNPYILGLPWKCSTLKEDVLYTVEVYDIWGRRFFANQFMGNRAFRIDGSIPPGTYIVIIRGGIDLHTEKLIIKG